MIASIKGSVALKKIHTDFYSNLKRVKDINKDTLNIIKAILDKQRFIDKIHKIHKIQ